MRDYVEELSVATCARCGVDVDVIIEDLLSRLTPSRCQEVLELPVNFD